MGNDKAMALYHSLNSTTEIAASVISGSRPLRKTRIMSTFIKKFNSISIDDIAEVGGKNASLGEMYNRLTLKGINIPNGFAISTAAFRHFIEYNKLDGVHKKILGQLDRSGYSNLNKIGDQLRDLILTARMPNDLAECIVAAYKALSEQGEAEVAVRSSATAEDLPQASFAGQHESYLNIKGELPLLEAVKKCFASLYTNRAIKYREDNGFDHSKILLSVGVQLMVRSDKACSGIGFTLEPESGFRNVIHLSGVWGLGENIVQGAVTPDEFILFKPALKANKRAIIQKNLGSKSLMMIYAEKSDIYNSTVNLETPENLRDSFVLSDEEITVLGNWALQIEEHYQKPMDLEWAKDGQTGQLFILQARPETVNSRKKLTQVKEYRMLDQGQVISTGEAIGSKISSGTARILDSPEEADRLMEGDILVTNMTSPDWDPILKTVSGIVTNKGGRTSHAAIVARELGVVAIVGSENATTTIRDGEIITVSCAEGKTGKVYRGALRWEETMHDFSRIHLPESPKIMMILGEPERAFEYASYPNNGIGLMRIEFIITHSVKIHPMALARFEVLEDQKNKQLIEEITHLYQSKEAYFVDKLSQGVATIAAAFYPREVIVRMSDFKTNEYANLLGGKQFEPIEQNPMIGFRGASRYFHDLYKEGFRLECEAMKVVRDEMGLTNVKLMIPFCRTPEEGRQVINVMQSYGLKQGVNQLEIYMMAEIPSNVILAEEFAEIFDGFSIGSNDLTQLTLGIDRDSSIIRHLFNEENAASREMIRMMIKKAKQLNKKIGLCGQAPSDSPAFASFLVEAGIDSISFNPDALLQGIENINKVSQPKKEPPQQFYETSKTEF